MIWQPRHGQRVQLHYAPKGTQRQEMPHLALGTVMIGGKGRIRNALVLLDDGRRLVVPAGNLFEAKGK